MKRAIKTALAASSLMVVLSVPAFAESGASAAGSSMTNRGGMGATTVTNGTDEYGTRGMAGTTAGTNAYTAANGNNRGMNNYTTDTNNNNGFRRYGVNSAGNGNNTMTGQRLRANAANDGMDWGWLGLLGLLGLSGLRGRNRDRETT
ncbi:hypothetical protein DNH61_04010 [Paenibacillus sambharensis]|uniref:MYXO-CTERM domain-containing protein n=1 Tax=Paenibacillus sambharensis TaxID=1803190 RepID=A0A2W1LA12_9BACL|nr:WGxxGxxG-CTERM domain-containing protein [Paenibacillus sambharensis]PZD97068.1 hypothetical protein DNH61_04010 [Paenibacillus sambharensis]